MWRACYPKIAGMSKKTPVIVANVQGSPVFVGQCQPGAISVLTYEIIKNMRLSELPDEIIENVTLPDLLSIDKLRIAKILYGNTPMTVEDVERLEALLYAGAF